MWNKEYTEENIEDAELIIENNEMKTEEMITIIKNEFTKLKRLEKSISEARNMAEKSKELAENAKKKEINWFGIGTTDAIQELQKATINISESLQESVIAHELSFEFQKQLSEISKYLFGLGIKNIASNRFVVNELEMKLKNASEEELDDLAIKEIETVIIQLKAQEDILFKIEKLQNKLKEQDGIANEITEKLEKQQKTNSNLEKIINEYEEKYKNLKEQLELAKEKMNLNDKRNFDIEKEMVEIKNSMSFKLSKLFIPSLTFTVLVLITSLFSFFK